MASANYWKSVTFFLAFIATLSLLIFSTAENWWYAEAANSSSFNVTLVISNSPPNISGIDATRTGTPTDGTTTTVYVLFNATDLNGAGDIDATSAAANLSKNGQANRLSSSCQEYAAWTAGNTKGINCSITMWYYDAPGTWTINVSVEDNANSEANETLPNGFTYNTLHAMQISLSTLTFSADEPGTDNVTASNNPLIVNNTGNGNYSNMNLTAYGLNNTDSNIGPGNFSVNLTSAAWGITLEREVMLNQSLNLNGTQNLYFQMNIPAGISTGNYATATEWIVEAIG